MAGNLRVKEVKPRPGDSVLTDRFIICHNPEQADRDAVVRGQLVAQLAEDKSLRAYLREVLTEHVAVPSMDQWLGHLRELGPNHVGAPSGAELVAAARAEDDAMAHR